MEFLGSVFHYNGKFAIDSIFIIKDFPLISHLAEEEKNPSE